MVFESFVADVLNRFLSKFVENVNKTQVNIGIWGGDVVLENLKLKPGALDDLDLPINTIYGHLGKLVLKIPWKNLYTAPVIINVESLFLLAAPIQDSVYDPEKEEQWKQDQKEKALKRVEDAKRREAQEEDLKSEDSFLEKLVTQIIKNIQIKVNDVHIRYEDRHTNRESPFAIGISLHRIYMYTTDAEWNETVILESVTKVNKIVVIDSLAIYWNCDCRLFKTDYTTPVLVKEFRDTICTQNYIPQNYHYILGPINGSSRLSLNTKPELDAFQIPKYQFDIQLSILAMAINKFQYHDMIRLAESLNRMQVSAGFMKYRPNLYTYKGHYKEWWRFAHTCILEEIVRTSLATWTWEYMARHRERCRKYAVAYRSKLLSREMSKQLKSELGELEKDLDVFNIILIREQVEMELEKSGLLNQEPDKKDPKGWGGWVAGWVRTRSNESIENTATTRPTSGHVQTQLENALTANEKAKLYKAIGYNEDSTHTPYPKTYVNIRVQFNLNLFEVQIFENFNLQSSRVLHLKLSTVKVDVDRLPAIKGFKMKMMMQRLCVYGFQQGDLTPRLVVSRDMANKIRLLDLLFELNPPDSGVDQRIHLSFSTLQIVYDACTMKKINTIFRAPNMRSYNRLHDHLENVKNMSASGLLYAIERRKALEVEVNMEASYLIMPYNGIYTRKEDILIINFGNFRIKSSPRILKKPSLGGEHPVAGSTKEDRRMNSIISQSYDRFILNLDSMQVLFALNGEKWVQVLKQKEVTPMHVLEPTTITAILNKCLIIDDPNLPIKTITATIHNIGITITNIRLRKLFLLLLSIRSRRYDPQRVSQEIRITPSDTHLQAADYLADRLRRGSFRANVLDNIPSIKPSSSSSQKKEPQAKKVQAIKMDLTCTVERLKVQILLEQTPSIHSTALTEFLILQLVNIEVGIVQQTFNTENAAHLGGIILEVLQLNNKKIKIIDTRTAQKQEVTKENLVSVQFIMVDKTSPELHTKYSSTGKFLNIQFTSMTLLLHQEVLVYVLQVLQTFMKQLKTDLSKSEITSPETVTKIKFDDMHNNLFMNRMRSVSSMMLRTKSRQLPLTDDETAFRLQIDLQKLNASIVNNDTAIADIAITGGSVKATILNSSKRFVIRLNKIEMLDCHKSSLHPCILSVVGEEMLSIELEMYKMETMTTQIKDSYPNMVFTAKIACMRIVYLNNFFTLLFIFFKKMIGFKTLFTDRTFGTAAVTSIQQQNINYMLDASYTKIIVDLDAPIFIVPLNSKSMEAVMLDFGYLTVNNEQHDINRFNEEDIPAFVDYIEIILKHIRVDRVKLRRNYSVINKKSLLLPATFFIAVERNLSMSSYQHIPACDISMRLQELRFTLTEEDYKMIRNILNQNFTETYVVSLNDEIVVDSDAPEEQIKGDRSLCDADDEEPEIQLNSSQTINLNINFLVENISVTLYTGGAAVLDDTSRIHPSACLACLSLHILSFQTTGLSNGKRRTSFRVVNCFLDDMREGRTNADVRLLQRKDDTPLIDQKQYQDENEFPPNTILDVSHTKIGSDTVIDVCVHEFQLILSLEYTAQLIDFFLSHRKQIMYGPEYQSNASVTASLFTLGLAMNQNDEVSNPPHSSMLVQVKFEKPDIVVVENFDPDNDALTMTCEMIMKLNSTSGKVVLDATLKDVQLNSCCFNVLRRKPKTGVILRPCSISVLGSVQKQGDINLDVCITEIKIVLSPSSIDYLLKIYHALFGKDSNKFANTYKDRIIDYSEIWQPRSLSEENFWFMHDIGIPTDFDSERRQSHASVRSTDMSKNWPSQVNQICVISVPSCMIYFETITGQLRQPLIYVQMKLESIIYDWSDHFFMNNNIALQMGYYNVSLASLEPLIEPIERVNNNRTSQGMWEFQANFQMNFPAPQKLPGNEKLPHLSITISSQEKLEVTLTKTGIDVLSKAINLFVRSEVLPETGETLAPFVVKNMSGLTVTLNLSRGPFQLDVKERHNRLTDIVIASGSQLGMCLKENEYFLSEDLSEMAKRNSVEIDERFLTISVDIDSKCCVLLLPVCFTDIRFFSLKYIGEFGEKWGLLWDISICEGSTVLTLRGIIKVYNHLKQPIHIYYLRKQGESQVLVSTVQPNEELNLPISAIYTESGALFFGVQGYATSNQAFMWKDLKSTHTISQLLSCSEVPQGGSNLFYINVVGFKKRLYFENSQHYSSDGNMYQIHLHPGVLMKNFLPVDIMICLDGSFSKNAGIIKAGEQMQMVNVEPGVTELFIKIPNYRNKHWLSENYLNWDQTSFNVIRFTSNDDDCQDALEISVFTKENNGTICKVLSCQFWMLNKTCLDIAYRQSSEHGNVVNHDKDLEEAVLFSLWGTRHDKNCISMCVSNGEWSKQFSLGAAGSSGVVCCKVEKKCFYIGVQITFTSSKLTQQITFTPYYVLVNNLNVGIECQEADCPDEPWVVIKHKDCTPFWPNNLETHKEICLRIEDSEEISIPFSYVMVHTTLIRLDNKYGGVYVDVHKMEGALYVTFWPYKLGLAPTLLINNTALPIQYWEQRGTGISILKPGEVQLYAWKSPNGSRTVTYRLWKKGELTDTLQKDGVEKFTYKSGQTIYWISFLEDNQRITLFTDDTQVPLRLESIRQNEPINFQLTLSIHSVGISFVNNSIMKEILYITLSSNGAIWESRKKRRKRFKPLPKVQSQLIEEAYIKYQDDISIGRESQDIVLLGRRFQVNLKTKEIIHPYRRYLKRIYQDGIWFRLKTMSNELTIHGMIIHLQIDNQMGNSVFPVVVAPVPPPPTVQANQRKKPFAELSVVRRYNENSPIIHYKYFKILIQAFYLKIEMDFVTAIGQLFDWEGAPEDVEVLEFAKDLKLAREPLRTNVRAISTQEEKYFYDLLHFSPLKIHVSFSLLTEHRQTEGYTLPLVMFILHGLGVTLTDFDNVVLKLSCFECKYTFMSHKETYHEATSHYISQILKQTYVLVLGLDLIGNPWGLFMGIRQGVTDLFYEPYLGIIQGPEDFGEGLLLGLRSMLGNTVGGTFGAVSKFSSAIGTGVAVLTFDHDYQHKRKQSLVQTPHNYQSRIAQSGRSLVMGMVEGVTGVVANPISGANREGVRGFFKGMGRGLAGLVVRPTVGVFDFVSNSLRLVSKTDSAHACRVRLPRKLSKDGLVRPFVRNEAEGGMLLELVEDGRFVNTDSYEYHLSGIKGTDDTVLLTSMRIMYIHVTSNSLAWEYTWDVIEPPLLNSTGIAIIKKGKKKGEIHKSVKQIPIESKKQRRRMFKKIEELRENNQNHC